MPWELTGNGGTDPTVDFVGTTDGQPLVIRIGNPATERLRIDAAGNVGIGTAVPVSPLDVRSASRIASLYTTTNGNQWVEVGNAVTHMNLGVGASGSTAGVPYLWSASGNFFVGDDGGPTLFVQGMGSGKVGIGTTTPAATLDVSHGLLHVEGSTNPTTTAQGAYLGWNALTGWHGRNRLYKQSRIGNGRVRVYEYAPVRKSQNHADGYYRRRPCGCWHRHRNAIRNAKCRPPRARPGRRHSSEWRVASFRGSNSPVDRKPVPE